jgi:hypothetical protein
MNVGLSLVEASLNRTQKKGYVRALCPRLHVGQIPCTCVHPHSQIPTHTTGEDTSKAIQQGAGESAGGQSAAEIAPYY